MTLFLETRKMVATMNNSFKVKAITVALIVVLWVLYIRG